MYNETYHLRSLQITSKFGRTRKVAVKRRGTTNMKYKKSNTKYVVDIGNKRQMAIPNTDRKVQVFLYIAQKTKRKRR